MMAQTIELPIFPEFMQFQSTKSKKLTCNIKFHEQAPDLYNTTLKDKHHTPIYFFDILEFDGQILLNLTNKKNYFICIWDQLYGRIDFLFYEYEIQDFIWVDNIQSCYFVRIASGIEILKDDEERKKLSISEAMAFKIKTMIDGRNAYYRRG